MEEENEGEKWTVIKLPALAEAADPLGRKPGEALCPARFNRDALLAKRKKLGSYSFSALYQQSPVPADGNVFKRAWFSRIIERAPDGLRWYRTYDLAISTKTSADYTASARIAQDKDGTIYIADIFRKRIEYPEQLRYITGRIEAERDTEHGIESALHGLAFIQELRRNAKLSSAAFRGISVSKDKLTRCLAWANRAEEGKLVLVRAPWNTDFIDEACSFPNGRHDDQIDAVSLAVEMLARRKHVAFGF
jgi:predicted phage terminase large subunit-like protein